MKRSNHMFYLKTVSAVMAGMLLVGGVTGTCLVTAHAQEAETFYEGKAVKDETVYVIASPDSNVQQIIVSDHLKNPGAEEILTDRSIFTQIENLKGEETFTQDEEGTITWQAEGNDIYYRGDGSADQQLPVIVRESFRLDGEEMSAEEITGKSGRVTIRFDYENTQTREAAESDAEGSADVSNLHVPFAALTGILLRDSEYSNLETVNAFPVGDGEHTLVVGAAFPGLREDLASDAYKSLTSLAEVSLPDYIEISADVEDFTPSDAYTVITNELFTDPDMTAEKELEKVGSAFSALSSSIGQIVGGISDLKDGAGDLKSGAQDLSDGLDELSENSEALNTGAGAIFDGLLETASAQLAAAGVPMDTPLEKDNYETLLTAIAGSVPAKMAPQVEEVKMRLKQAAAFCEGLSEYTQGVEEAKSGANTLKDGAASLQSGAMKLSLGIGILQAALPDLSGLSDSVNASVNLARGYNTWSGISDDMEGKVRFIWVTR